MDLGFQDLTLEIDRVAVAHAVGRVVQITSGGVKVAGLSARACQGDRVQVGNLDGEVIALEGSAATILTEQSPEGLKLGERVILAGKTGLSPDISWVGRIIDPYGQPLDGLPLRMGPKEMPLRPPAPPAAQRRRLGSRLETGLCAFDTLLPIVRGQRIGLFAGSGVGKSSLLGAFAKGVSADVAVIALIGERGRELREFVEETLGEEGLKRAVVITATSDQSALARRRCAWAAMTVAEFLRDQGKHVLFLADSVTRFAEAHREIALAAGEMSVLRGYPPSLSQAIMGLAERAGPGLNGLDGDITAVFSVLVAGSDMEEPVADILRGVLDGHVVLDRQIAERGRFPAVDTLRSVSRSLPHAASADENALISQARHLMGTWDRAEMMVQAGLYAKGSDPMIDRAIEVIPALDRFMGEIAPEAGIAGSFERLRHILR